MTKPFKKFIREQEERSGSLERDPITPVRNKTLRGAMNVDPAHRANVLRIAKAILKDREGGLGSETTVTDKNIGDFAKSNQFTTLKQLEDLGVSPSDSMRARETAEKILSGDKKYIEGIHPDVIAGLRRQAKKPVIGQNLDVEG